MCEEETTLLTVNVSLFTFSVSVLLQPFLVHIFTVLSETPVEPLFNCCPLLVAEDNGR